MRSTRQKEFGSGSVRWLGSVDSVNSPSQLSQQEADSVNSVDPVNSLTRSTQSGGSTFRREDSVKNLAREHYLR
ncbi:hypothetical protein HanPSC8_Chr06g0241421 [Helianthus annuus]|nr:hypothetical protein HanPSC8_Chr06g0241421 [Helianthus annuus]